jgi:hypothetical protein
MRTCLVIVAALSLAACKWTEFDDLANTTWAHSDQKPDVGSSDYAIAIAGASTGTTGGRLAVVSNDAPTYSTLAYDEHGGTSVGPGPLRLGDHFIASLGEQPLLVSDGAGHVALVAAAKDAGNIAVVRGDGDTTTDMPFAAPQEPDAAAFAGGTLVIAAGSDLYLLDGTNPAVTCTPTDPAGAPLSVAALAADDANLYVWAKDGAFFGYDLAALAGGCTGTITVQGFTSTGFLPGLGAQVHVVGTSSSSAEYAILAAHADKSTMGQVFVVDLRTGAAVGTPLPADGIRSSTVGAYGAGAASTFVALGFPDRTVDGVVAGEVELHAFDPATGALTSDPAEVLSDAKPEGNQVFGRALATMSFDGAQILVVAASNEVFAYYRTALYPDTRP